MDAYVEFPPSGLFWFRGRPCRGIKLAEMCSMLVLKTHFFQSIISTIRHQDTYLSMEVLFIRLSPTKKWTGNFCKNVKKMSSSFKSNAFSITAVGLGHLLTWSCSYIRKTSLWSILFQTEHPNNVYLKKSKIRSFRTKIARSAYKIGRNFFRRGFCRADQSNIYPKGPS